MIEMAIRPETIRLSIGIEHIDDIIDDIPWLTEPLHLLGGCGVLRPVPADRLQTWSATSDVKCAMSDGVNPELLE
jgi:hypothetical protein